MRASWWLRTAWIAVALAGCTVPSTVRLASDGGAEASTDVREVDGPATLDASDASDAVADGATPDVPTDSMGTDSLVADVPSVPDVVVGTDVPNTADASDAGLCTSALECSDGVFCNGEERCMPGAAGASSRGCLAASAPACDAATQVCNEAMRRCDPNPCTTPDRDSDGHRAIACGGDDCDDNDRLRYPGAFEVCDRMGRDEDCNPTTLGLDDRDMDGAAWTGCCAMGAGGVLTCGTDCDDARSFVRPGGTETCNGFDDNCSGEIDEGFMRMTYYYDADGDLYGNPSTGVLACAAPPSYYLQGGDCNDSEETIYPGNGCP